MQQACCHEKGKVLYSGSMRELIRQAEGHVWTCTLEDEREVRALEKNCHVSSKQFSAEGMHMRIISRNRRTRGGSRQRQPWRTPIYGSQPAAVNNLPGKRKMNRHVRPGVDCNIRQTMDDVP